MATALGTLHTPWITRSMAMLAALALGFVLAESPVGAAAAEVSDTNQTSTTVQR